MEKFLFLLFWLNIFLLKFFKVLFLIFFFFLLSFHTEEHPPEVKLDLSSAVLKEEPVIMEVKVQDGAAPVVTAAPPTASSGSGRRKKKQKVEAVVTGRNTPKSDKLERIKFSVVNSKKILL